MKKPAASAPLLNRLARGIGHAAGRLAAATQGVTRSQGSAPPAAPGGSKASEAKPAKRQRASKKKASKSAKLVKRRTKR